MQIHSANHSGFPTPADDDEIARVAAGIRSQEEIGLDYVTDGTRSGAALLQTIMETLDGVRPGAPMRAPFLAAEHRQPRVQAKVRRRRSLLAPRYAAAAATAARPLKALLFGPYTLARLSRIETTAYRQVDALAADLSIVLAEEVRALVDHGARLIQVDEPMILHHPEDVRLLRELLEPLQTAVEATATLAVATYGADATALYAQLNSLPGEILCLDCASSPALIEVIGLTGAGKPLALGLLDGQRAAVESPSDCANLLERALRRYEHQRIFIQPASGMETLDGKSARAKLSTLVEVQRRLAPRFA